MVKLLHGIPQQLNILLNDTMLLFSFCKYLVDICNDMADFAGTKDKLESVLHFKSWKHSI